MYICHNKCSDILFETDNSISYKYVDKKNRNKKTAICSPNTVVGVINTVGVATEALPMKPSHWRSFNQTIVQCETDIDGCNQEQDTRVFQHLLNNNNKSFIKMEIYVKSY